MLGAAMSRDALPSPYFDEAHELLRTQLQRFVDEVRPEAAQWEEAGRVPRDVLRRMGSLGFLAIRHEEAYGGSAMDTLGSIVLAEELGRSTFGGFAITVLVHTDMASPHLARFGSAAQKRRWLPGIVAGEIITAIAVT
jgi:acyl-CoA dehydrogenase